MPSISGIEKKQEVTDITSTQEEMGMLQRIKELQQEIFEFQQIRIEQDRKKNLLFTERTFLIGIINLRHSYRETREGWTNYLQWINTNLPEYYEARFQIYIEGENEKTFFDKVIEEICILFENIFNPRGV